MAANPPKPRGRPSKRRRKRTGPSTPDDRGPSPGPESPPSIDTALPADASQGIQLAGVDARHALLAAQNSARAPDPTAAEGQSHRLFLNVLPHATDKGWKLVKRMPIEDLAPWFDDLANDFHVHSMHPSQDVPVQSLAVLVKWIGHPGSTPRDPRARRCFIRWNDPKPPENLIEAAIEKKQPVVRWDLRCAGVHDLDFSEQPEQPADDESENDKENKVSDSEEVTQRVSRWKECSMSVKLHAEVYAEDLNTVSVWQQYEHPDVPVADRAKGLQFSCLQHSIFLERLRLHGMKVSSLVMDSLRLSPAALGRTTPLPSWREATHKELSSMHVAVKHRQLLDRNPWRATHLLVRANRNKIFGYIEHDFSKPDTESQFAIGLTDDYSLDSAISYSLNDGGLGSDQCWRHKSQNRAAMSLLCTVDEGGHMVPVACFISANAKTQTLLDFFCGTYEKVVARAQAVVKNPNVISNRNRTPEVIETIRLNAAEIVENGWQIGEVMIDKHYPSLRALRAFARKYNLNLYIRICQFHVVRAILYWEWSDGRKGLSVVISKQIKFQIIWLFRFVQRARTREEFDTLAARFIEEVKAVIMEDNLEDEDEATEEEENEGKSKKAKDKKRGKGRRGKPKSPEVRQAMAEAVCNYFESNWFVDDWIDHYTDIGLPPDRGRDGIWNTNNWSESAFKTFDTVFLHNRQNKRIDRLASIILNDFLPYYQYWQPADKQPPQGVIELHHTAYTLWDRGAVTILNTDLYAVDMIANGQAVRFEVCMNPMKCKCLDYQQTGKLCLHILAVQLFVSNGPVEAWMDAETKSETAIPKRHKGEPKRKKVKGDAAENAELYDILAQLKDAEEKERDQLSESPEPPFSPAIAGTSGQFAAMGRSPGRPPNSQPLQPGRTPRKSAHHEPKFSRKQGRPPAGRLAPNSLFPGTLGNAGKPRRSARHMDNAGNLTLDELEMNTAALTRWDRLDYMMRAEEMEQWSTILNYSEIAQRDGWLFVSCSPTCLPPAVVSALDWSVPITTEQLHLQRLETLAQVFEERQNIQLNHLVCFHLYGLHWTIFHHDLTREHRTIERFNPLVGTGTRITDEAELGFSIEDQVLLTMYLHPRRLSALQTGELSEKPRISGAEKVFTHYYLGLQRSDSTTCGFWCVFAVFAMLLRFSLEQKLVHDMDCAPANLKGVLAPIYSTFRGDAIGVPVDLVRQLFEIFQPNFNYISLTKNRFSIRPENIARAEARDNHANISPDVALNHVTDPALGDVTWLIGAHRPSASNIRDLRDGKELHCVLLDAYLGLVVEEMISTKIPSPKFLVVDSLVAKDMQDSKKGSEAQGMAPKARVKREIKYWFEGQNIFLLDWLLIPWFWSLHWMVVGVDFGATAIYVYDSYKERGGKTRARAATERTLQMLKWEHRARYHGDALGPEWTAEVRLLDVPQQGNTVHCGLFTIWFVKQLAQGNTDVSRWSFTAKDCEAERLEVLNRVSAAIHADPQERNIEQLARVGFGQEGLPNPLQASVDAWHKSVADAMYPFLPSTDVASSLSVEEWRLARDKRLENVQIGTCLLMCHPSNGKAYPYIVGTMTEKHLTLDLFEGIYDKVPEDMGKGYTVDRQQVADANLTYRACTLEALPRIEWPAHLTTFPLFFPSPLFPRQEALANTLRSLLPQIAGMFYRSSSEAPADVFSYIDNRFQKSLNRPRFYKEFLGTAPGREPFCAADEGFFTFLGGKIREIVPFDPPEVSTRKLDSLLEWIKGAARSMLATAAAAHYLEVDFATVVDLLEARRIHRPQGRHETVLETYAHAIRDEPLGHEFRLREEVLVVTPGIAIPFPRAM